MPNEFDVAHDAISQFAEFMQSGEVEQSPMHEQHWDFKYKQNCYTYPELITHFIGHVYKLKG